LDSASDAPILDVTHAGMRLEIRDAAQDSRALRLLIEGIRLGGIWSGLSGSFHALPTPAASSLPAPSPSGRPLRAEQSNTSIVFDERVLLKTFRKLEAGIHPEVEVAAFLTSHGAFPHVPRLFGSLEYRCVGMSAAAALLQEFVPNQGDGWGYVQTRLKRLVREARCPAPDGSATVLQRLEQLAGDLRIEMRKLGELTGRLHVALAADPASDAFRPEPVTADDVAAWQRMMEGRLEATFASLFSGTTVLAEGLELSRTEARRLAEACRRQITGLGRLAEGSLVKIRQHGDYHLGQVLRVGSSAGFVVLDFEGEPARPLMERRAKHCGLKDVAGMLRSFGYVTEAVAQEDGGLTASDRSILTAWEEQAGEAFLQAYERLVAEASVPLLPADEVRAAALRAFLIDKAVYELGYELNNRPTWANIPLRALQKLCGFNT
jgi:maltose alpha-D-glucosyltransferase/alpha-amylase